MPRLLRVHFASIGHADARLAPLTLDFRATDGSGTGTDTVLWLRNGGGKSTILNLFYSLFRPDRREFLGASAEGRARHLEDYVKAEDLAFVVTEWDVAPAIEPALLAQPPLRKRIVGQVLAWRDRQKSSDPSRLRRRFFSLLADAELGLEDLPIEGLGPAPVRSFDAFRDALDRLREARPELEAHWEDAPRRWTEHLEKIHLDPELFRYQLRMNAREGSADEAFRFRTTDEFVRFYLEIAFESGEADLVSANVERFREKLARRPELLAERAFLADARRELGPLKEAVAALSAASERHRDESGRAAAVARALAMREVTEREVSAGAARAAELAREAEREAENASARLGRWAKGLQRRALELDVAEAEAARGAAQRAADAATEDVRVAEAAIARDARRDVEARRDAKAAALRAAEAEREPLRRQVARAGATVRARLAEAAESARATAAEHRVQEKRAAEARSRADRHRDELLKEQTSLGKDLEAIDQWLTDRDRERERLRASGILDVREEPADAAERWRATAGAGREEAARQAVLREEAKSRAARADEEVAGYRADLGRFDAEIAAARKGLDAARRERERILGLQPVRELAGDLDVPGLADQLRSAADSLQRQTLVAAVEGAEDERAGQALERTGRLPPTADVERALATLGTSGVPAWSASEYLAANISSDRDGHVRADPAAWHGVVVPDPATLERARGLLATWTPRSAVTIITARVDAEPVRADRFVLPGHPAHWDERAGAALRDEIGERRRRRERERAERLGREREARDAAGAVERWRAAWGDGRLAVAEADLEQKSAARERTEAGRLEAQRLAEASRTEERAAEEARKAADTGVNRAEQTIARLVAFLERFADVDARRTERARVEARRVEVAGEIDRAQSERDAADAARLRSRDEAIAVERLAGDLLDERDRVDLLDEAPPDAADLVLARATWGALRQQWEGVVSGNRLQWELGQLEDQLRAALADERKRSQGREDAVAAVTSGAAAHAAAVPRQERARDELIRAGMEERRAREALLAEGVKRREADDLPDGPPPATAAAARAEMLRRRAEREDANDRARAHADAAAAHEKLQRDAEAEAERCLRRGSRLRDVLGEVAPGDASPLPEGGPALDALVDTLVRGLRAAEAALASARQEAEERAEAVRAVALATVHEPHRSRAKERLRSPAPELAASADALLADVEDRLAVVRTTLDEIDQDRRLVLKELDKVAMDGVHLLQAAHRASRLPAGLGPWEGLSFLDIKAEVPEDQASRHARLEPLVDRLIAKGAIPGGRELVDAAVRELAGQRISATILKPDAVLRRDRLPVTDVQTFSRGQQLTVAILLYCTMARLRAQQRGRANRADAGVLLLDNPVGTCSSVPLLDLQREVARQMRVQLVYTTGVNDAHAVATFPNTIRLRNAHRARGSGDLHVTTEPGTVEAVRIVAT